MRASALALFAASITLLGVGGAEAQGRRARHAPPRAPVADPAYTGSLPGSAPAWGTNAGRPLTSQGGGTIHWNTGNQWGNLGGPNGGGGGMGG